MPARRLVGRGVRDVERLDRGHESSNRGDGEEPGGRLLGPFRLRSVSRPRPRQNTREARVSRALSPGRGVDGGTDAPSNAIVRRVCLGAVIDLGDSWIVNARGDALLVDTYSPRALAVDVSGTRAELSIPERGGRRVEGVAADLGEDGTAAIAWTERLPGVAATDAFAFVRLRPPGGQFGWVVRVPTGGEARDMDVRVRPDGLVELLHMFWDGSAHHFPLTALRAQASTAPVAGRDDNGSRLAGLAVLGSGRALFGFSPVASLCRPGQGPGAVRKPSPLGRCSAAPR